LIIKPLIRDNICLSSHPVGCAAAVRRHIDLTRRQFEHTGTLEDQPLRLALVIGCSTGYGLAGRIVASFGYGAATVGISYEKAGTATKPGSPGWYNNRTFTAEAALSGLCSTTLDGDAFQDATKDKAADAIRELARAANIPPLVDLIIYSLASPVRVDPESAVMYRSVIKPIGQPFSGQTIDMLTGKIREISVEPATEDEIFQTVKVMGGEDWERWIGALDKAGVLSPHARTIAYTYIGPELSWAIYKNGTIGRAKADLERAAKAINEKFSSRRMAWVSVNKALVTRSSAVIPIIPFYMSCLFKVMKEKGLHEGCIEQSIRLFRDRLYADNAKIPVDGDGRIRIDDWEMREDVQRETAERMQGVTQDNLFIQTDIAGFKRDFLETHGFDIPGVDYEADVDLAQFI
jgi:enoyl-[acyl-carrier protein] reductase/trans-2-enoyl-CoA reductase (NAD+)